MRNELLLSSIALLAASTLLACADPEPEIWIREIAVIAAPECELTIEGQGTTEREFRAAGVWDVAAGRPYILAPIIDSMLQPSESVEFATEGGGGGGLEGADYEANRIALTNATISFSAPAEISAALPASQVIRISGTLEPGGTVGFTAAIGTPETVRALAASLAPGAQVDMEISIEMDGETNVGNAVDSNVFVYTVTVCNGCLAAFNPTTDGRQCAGSLDEIPVCNVGTDEQYPCNALCDVNSPLVTADDCPLAP